jgi:hypothetical protein
MSTGETFVQASPKARFWVSHVTAPARVGFIFPGQGSQLLNAATRIVKRNTWAQVRTACTWLAAS